MPDDKYQPATDGLLAAMAHSVARDCRDLAEAVSLLENARVFSRLNEPDSSVEGGLVLVARDPGEIN